MAENKKKRKWLSTQALKEFINEITEEELNAEEMYNELSPTTTFNLLEESEALIQEKENSNESKNQEEKLQYEEDYSDKYLILQQAAEKLDAQKKEAEIRIHELEIENDDLKEKLDFERIRVGDELTERDKNWQEKLTEIEEEKQVVEEEFIQLEQQLEEKQRELEEFSEIIKKEASEKEAAAVDLKELTRQLKEYQKNYEAVQEENREQEKS